MPVYMYIHRLARAPSLDVLRNVHILKVLDDPSKGYSPDC